VSQPSADPHRGLPHAVLIDMDGLLIDSEPAWFEAEAEVLARLGFHLAPEHYERLVGLSVEGVMTRLIELSGTGIGWRALNDLVESEMADRLACGVRMMNGAKELLTALHTAAVPMALVTSSSRQVTKAVLQSVGDDLFACVVTGDDVQHPKPHPEAYLLAAKHLGLRPEDCVALEDSPSGTASGVAAGCRVIAVPYTAPVTASDRVCVVASLLDIDVAYLRERFAHS
jgi:HAD superfamily hydrolase (TIGR01509 family)